MVLVLLRQCYGVALAFAVADLIVVALDIGALDVVAVPRELYDSAVVGLEVVLSAGIAAVGWGEGDSLRRVAVGILVFKH